MTRPPDEVLERPAALSVPHAPSDAQKREVPRHRPTTSYVPKHAAEPAAEKVRINIWLWLVLLVLSGFVAGTTAAFNASVSDPTNTFGTAALAPPDSQKLTLAGTDLKLQVPAFGSVDGGGVVGARWRYYYPTGVSSTGTAPNCDTNNSSYLATADLGSTQSQGTDKVVPQSSFASPTPGRWSCVMAFTTYPAADQTAPAVQWMSQAGNPRNAIQLGYVVQSVALNDGGGTAGTMQNGDQIIITFNQRVDSTNGRPSLPTVAAPYYVCIPKNGTGDIYVGVTVCNNNVPTSVSALHLENKANVTVPNNTQSWAITSATDWAWADDAALNTTTLTITLRNGTSTVAISGTGCTVSTTSCFLATTALTAGTTNTTTMNAGGTLRSQATPYAMLCKAQPSGSPNNGTCFPDATGRF